MADPITWRSLGGNNSMPADAAVPIRYAGDQLNQGFAQLQKALGMVTDNQEANWQNQKVNNTQDFLDRLSQYSTPEQLEAARASGELAKVRAGFGAQVDRAAVRGAEENRIGVLRQSILAGQEYGDKQLDRSQLPVVEQIKAAAAKGDMGTVQSLMAANPELRNIGALTEKAVMGDRSKQEFGFKVNDDKREGEKHIWTGTKMQDDLLTAASNRAQMAASAQASRASAALSGVRAKGEGIDNNLKQLALAEKQEEQQYAKAFDSYILQHQARVADAKSKGMPVDALPSDSEAMRGAAMEITKALGKDLNPSVLNRVIATKAEGFDAGSGMNATIGRDQRAKEAEKAAQQERDRIVLENSPAGTGALNPIRDNKEIQEFIGTIMGKDGGKPKDMVRSAVNKVMTDGYKLKDGSKIPVTKDILMQAISETRDDRTWLDKWANNEGSAGELFTKALDRLMSNDAVINGIKARQSIENSLPDRKATLINELLGKEVPKQKKKDK